jgi:hypothetical protein
VRLVLPWASVPLRGSRRLPLSTTRGWLLHPADPSWGQRLSGRSASLYRRRYAGPPGGSSTFNERSDRPCGRSAGAPSSVDIGPFKA